MSLPETSLTQLGPHSCSILRRRLRLTSRWLSRWLREVRTSSIRVARSEANDLRWTQRAPSMRCLLSVTWRRVSAEEASRHAHGNTYIYISAGRDRILNLQFLVHLGKDKESHSAVNVSGSLSLAYCMLKAELSSVLSFRCFHLPW